MSNNTVEDVIDTNVVVKNMLGDIEKVESYEPDVRTDRTRRHIYNKLKSHLEKKYGKGNLVNEIMKEHGLDAKRFDFMSSVENFILNKINDVSIDPNANKAEKHMEAVIQEACNPIRKAIGFDLLYRSMKELYGYEKANELSMLMYDYSLALHDSVKIYNPYCFALPTTFLITEGRNWGALPSTPAQRLDSYIAGLCECVHQISNSLAGAVAASSIFRDVAAILMCYKGIIGEPVSLNELKNNKLIRKLVENELQQFIHSLNSLTRMGIESPFSNVTVCDEIKLTKKAREYQWLYEKPNGDLYSVEEIVEYTMEVQKIFIELFDKGIPLRGGMQYRFPVTTVALAKDDNGELVEGEFFNWMTNNTDITRYNIFMSHGEKTCSCCRLISDEEMESAGSNVQSLANTSDGMGSHRVVTVNFPRLAIESSSMEDFFDKLDKLTESSAFILKSHKHLLQKLEKAGFQPFITNGTINLDRMYSTFGVIGLVECVEIMKKKFNVSDEFMGDMLTHFKNKCTEYSRNVGIVHNIEQVPGESFAPRLAKIDRILFGKEEQPYVMYSNQFVPLWDKKDAFERLIEDGKYNLKLTGGGIVHLTSSERFTPTQARKIIRFSCKCGCEHFAINACNSICENNHYVRGKFETCPICQGKVIDYMQRVVGFATFVSSWNPTRRDWEFGRRHEVSFEEYQQTFKD